MRLNKILSIGAVFALALGLASCDKNKENPNDLTNGTGEKAWTSFTVALPTMSGLRAEAGNIPGANHGDTYGGTVGEQKVANVLIALYKDGVVKYVFTPSISADGTNPFTGDVSTETTATATASKFTTKAVELVKDTYEVFVFLNPTQYVIDNTKVGAHKNDLEKAADYAEADLTAGTGFFMSNAKGGVMTVDANFKPSPEAAEAATASVKVPVERAVAKVFANATVSGVANNATATVKRFALDVINKKYFSVRKMGFTTDGSSPEPTGTTATDRMASYAVDPNMAGNPTKFAVATPDQLTSEFSYIGADKTFASVPTGHTIKAAGFDDDAKGIYVSENTMDALEQYEVATTRVIFEVEYAPNGFTAGESFVEYRGMIFKPAAFQDKVNAYLADNAKTDADLGMPVGFVAEIKALKDAGTATTFDLTKSFVLGNIKFFLNGISYYKATIRHFDNDQAPWTTGQPLKYGRYGVVRNNIYKLNITKLTSPGDPVIPQPKPEEPDDKDKTYLAVQVDVLPWLVRTQNVEL